MQQNWSESFAEAAIAHLSALDGPLLPMLHALHCAFGCIPEPATAFLARKLNLSRAEVHGVISFYHDFRREPAGSIVIKFCRAEACQAMGGERISRALLTHLGIGWNETAKDGAITVIPVFCLGLCAAAPAALINDAPAARLDEKRLIAQIEAMR